jgi:octopine/nopaline transport system permease protein
VARLEVTNTYAPYEVFLTAGAIYFCVTTSISWALRILERRFAIESLKALDTRVLKEADLMVHG